MSSGERKPIPGFLALFFRLFLAAALILPLAAAAAYFSVERLIQKEEAQTPDLLTMDVRAALEAASTAGFGLVLEGQEASSAVAPGKVLSQRPSADMWAKTGSTIRIVVSRRP